MPIFEVEHNGTIYEVDAPDIQQAASAAQAFSPAAPTAPAAPVPLDQVGANEVPTGANLAASQAEGAPAPQEEPGLFSRAMNAVAGDPIIDMWLSSLGTATKGAPETIANAVGNSGVAAVAGLTAPFVSKNPSDAADYIRDFTRENASNVGELFGGASDAGVQTTEALGEAFQPVQNIKQKLGETTLDLTGSPDAAATMDMAPDFLATVLGIPGVTKAAERLPKTPLKQTPSVNPAVENLRAADIRLRPSDVRAMEPGAPKVPGEFRERFADAPELKKDMTLHNQARFTDLAAEELGIKKLDAASLEKAREAPTATYDMVENVLREREMSQAFADTFREAAASAKLAKGENYSVTRIIGTLRRRAAKRMQADDVKTEEAGFADRELADRLEEQLGKELESAGEPQLFKQYQEARQQFAKIHDVETATRANQIDANVLRKMRDKGVKLSGRLALIADASEFAPNVTQHSLKTAARAGGEIESSKEGIIKGLLKAGVRKLPGMDVGSPGFQETLGAVNPTQAANYARPANVSAPRSPQQPELDLREILQLDTPGSVGPRPPRAPAAGEQADIFGGPLELQPPQGRAGTTPATTARDLGEVMVDGEPLAEPAVNFRANTLADILGLSEPIVKPPRKKPRG